MVASAGRRRALASCRVLIFWLAGFALQPVSVALLFRAWAARPQYHGQRIASIAIVDERPCRRGYRMVGDSFLRPPARSTAQNSGPTKDQGLTAAPCTTTCVARDTRKLGWIGSPVRPGMKQGSNQSRPPFCAVTLSMRNLEAATHPNGSPLHPLGRQGALAGKKVPQRRNLVFSRYPPSCPGDCFFTSAVLSIIPPAHTAVATATSMPAAARSSRDLFLQSGAR